MDGQIKNSALPPYNRLPGSNNNDGIASFMPDEEGTTYDSKAKLYEWLVGTRWYNKMAWGTSPFNYKKFALKAYKDGSGPYLDIGCGGLTHTSKIYASGNRPTVLLDSSRAMLRLAKRKLLQKIGQVPGRIRLLQADAFALPFGEESFSTVAAFGIFHLFDNKEEFLEEALRVLEPGGSFYFSALHTDRPFGKKYLHFLYKHGETGIPMCAAELMDFFGDGLTDLSSCCDGNMIFIKGKK